MDIKSIHLRIEELCKQRQWSYYRLSKETGFQQSTLKSIVKEKNMPSLYTIHKICLALHISLSDFFDSELFDTNNLNKQYITLWKTLTSQDKEKVLIYMYGLSHQLPKKEE